MGLAEMLALVATLPGIALVGLFLTNWFKDNYSKKGKVILSWTIGVVLSFLLLGASK
jgi:hypothetical protein